MVVKSSEEYVGWLIPSPWSELNYCILWLLMNHKEESQSGRAISSPVKVFQPILTLENSGNDQRGTAPERRNLTAFTTPLPHLEAAGRRKHQAESDRNRSMVHLLTDWPLPTEQGVAHHSFLQCLLLYIMFRPYLWLATKCYRCSNDTHNIINYSYFVVRAFIN